MNDMNEFNELSEINETAEINQEILNDDKITAELHEKLNEYETQVKEYDEKKKELQNTLSDLNRKTSIDDISDSTKEKIAEVVDKVKEKISELDSQTDDLNTKIKEINETLNPAPEIPEPPEIPEVPENPEEIKRASEIAKLENKIRELENKKSRKETEISEIETQRSELETRINSPEKSEFNSQIDAQIQIIENQKNKLDETINTINEKIDDDDINDATRERLEEMREEVEEKIEELDEKIEDLQDKKDEYEEELNDKIDELNDRIDEINEEIEEINEEIDEINDEMNDTVDEDVIEEVKKSSGFEDLGTLISRITDTVTSALSNIKIPPIADIKIPEINIPKLNIRIPEKRFSSVNYEKKPKEQQYNVNFCSNKEGAKIHSVCCEHSWGERAANLIDDDPKFNEKWCAANDHGKFKMVYPHWVIIDFGEVKTFNYLKLVKCSAGAAHPADPGNKNFDASAWRFEISNDREHWVEFNRETNDHSSVYEKNFRQLTGRYVRLFIDAGGSDPNNKYHGVRLYDLRIEMRDEDGNGVNLCKGAGIESCCGGNWGAAIGNLIDGNADGSKWYVENAHEEKVPGSHWVIIDMGELRTFNHIRIAKASAGKHDFGDKYKDMSAWCAEVSGDMTNWTTFSYETNDRSSVYEKTFSTQTGRYIRLWVDAAESDPKNKYGHVRLYDLRIEMLDRKANEGEVTFDDIIAIAPFANAQTIDKLVDKLTVTDDFSKIQALAPFISQESLDKLVVKAAVKADFNTIAGLSPFLSAETLDKIVENLDGGTDFSQIHSLAPFVSQETLVKLVEKSGGENNKIDMNLLRSLAPFLGSDYIDKIISNML